MCKRNVQTRYAMCDGQKMCNVSENGHFVCDMCSTVCDSVWNYSNENQHAAKGDRKPFIPIDTRRFVFFSHHDLIESFKPWLSWKVSSRMLVNGKLMVLLFTKWTSSSSLHLHSTTSHFRTPTVHLQPCDVVGQRPRASTADCSYLPFECHHKNCGKSQVKINGYCTFY